MTDYTLLSSLYGLTHLRSHSAKKMLIKIPSVGKKKKDPISDNMEKKKKKSNLATSFIHNNINHSKDK